MTRRRLEVRHERFKVRGVFTIARGARTHADVVLVEIFEGELCGRGEGVPYARGGETVESVLAQIRSQRELVENGGGRGELLKALPPGAARNALDCALWDLEAKLAKKPVWRLAGIQAPKPVTTAFTISLGTPQAMAEAARQAADRPILKVKLGGEGDPARIRAVRAAAPKARLIVDANESWHPDRVASWLDVMAECGVELVEQPLPAGQDAMLADIPHPVPVGADESVLATDSLDRLVGRYEFVNLKLDKAGGFTEGLAFVRRAQELGFGLMVGCMLGTSLAIAPAVLLAQRATFVDLDGPLLLAEDRSPGLRYQGSVVYPPSPELWG
ncbi:MAG: dipeptide epimerase [Geminicoccaceae bacterium]|nr:dipeptide epimerase [Geminicoccaceae bacterium]MCS7267101.1 dipeptide epimerase [Geminicoccaceae bacterium]MCX7630037.1 dipeptide epimerase [Geminicoccaceae bacterium]MDW8341727.1 N-acetyl-D-Glu racemase DgcA [Geminicoccaceae bacterium]